MGDFFKMSDTVIAIRPCPVCACSIEVEFDPKSHDVRLTSESVPALARDKLAVVAEYRKIKGLGLDWEKKHRPRAIIYAQGIIEAMGSTPQAAALAVEAVGWVAAHSESSWDLSDVQVRVQEFLRARSEAREQERKSKCCICGHPAIAGGTYCLDHSWCRVCEESIPHGRSYDDGDYPICAKCKGT